MSVSKFLFKMINKKAQITFFIIIGILALFVTGFVVFTFSSAFNEIIPQYRVLPKDVMPIQSYVESCLKVVSENGLVLVASQGGHIYQSQGGLTDEDRLPAFVSYSGFKVPYLIRRRGFWIGFFSANPPDYPWEFFPCESTPTCTNPVFKAPIFGEGRLPPLEREGGPRSIQSQLEAYVKNNIQDCIDFEVFRESFEVSKPSMGDINVEFMIAERDTRVKMKYPIIIKHVATGDIFNIQDFQVIHNIRLRKLYSFTQQIINNDAEDVKFDPDGARQGGVIARVTRNVREHDDLIIITDTNSFVGGDTYKFYFARQNRNPALSYIDTTGMTQITRDDLVAYDPDEDDLTFGGVPLISGTGTITVSDGQYEDYQEVTLP